MRDDACPVCLIGHNEEIHEATVQVHRWLRERINQIFAGPPTKRRGKNKPWESAEAIGAK